MERLDVRYAVKADQTSLLRVNLMFLAVLKCNVLYLTLSHAC